MVERGRMETYGKWGCGKMMERGSLEAWWKWEDRKMVGSVDIVEMKAWKDGGEGDGGYMVIDKVLLIVLMIRFFNSCGETNIMVLLVSPFVNL